MAYIIGSLWMPSNEEKRQEILRLAPLEIIYILSYVKMKER